MKLKKRNPSHPAVTERVLAHIQVMSPEDLLEMLTYRKEGVEQTDMNATLKEYDRAPKSQTGIRARHNRGNSDLSGCR